MPKMPWMNVTSASMETPPSSVPVAGRVLDAVGPRYLALLGVEGGQPVGQRLLAPIQLRGHKVQIPLEAVAGGLEAFVGGADPVHFQAPLSLLVTSTLLLPGRALLAILL